MAERFKMSLSSKSLRLKSFCWRKSKGRLGPFLVTKCEGHALLASLLEKLSGKLRRGLANFEGARAFCGEQHYAVSAKKNGLGSRQVLFVLRPS